MVKGMESEVFFSPSLRKLSLIVGVSVLCDSITAGCCLPADFAGGLLLLLEDMRTSPEWHFTVVKSCVREGPCPDTKYSRAICFHYAFLKVTPLRPVTI